MAVVVILIVVSVIVAAVLIAWRVRRREKKRLSGKHSEANLVNYTFEKERGKG